MGFGMSMQWLFLLLEMLTTAGMGIKTTTIPIMTSEIVPAAIRGGLVMSFQLFVAFGILVYVAHLSNSLRCPNRS